LRRGGEGREELKEEAGNTLKLFFRKSQSNAKESVRRKGKNLAEKERNANLKGCCADVPARGGRGMSVQHGQELVLKGRTKEKDVGRQVSEERETAKKGPGTTPNVNLPERKRLQRRGKKSSA